jgi:hypothetical protein
MSSGVIEPKIATSQNASLTYAVNTNISIAEPAHIIHKALEEFRRAQPTDIGSLPTLSELRAKNPKPPEPTELMWETWTQPKP